MKVWFSVLFLTWQSYTTTQYRDKLYMGIMQLTCYMIMCSYVYLINGSMVLFSLLDYIYNHLTRKCNKIWRCRCFEGEWGCFNKLLPPLHIIMGDVIRTCVFARGWESIEKYYVVRFWLSRWQLFNMDIKSPPQLLICYNFFSMIPCTGLTPNHVPLRTP